MTEHKDYRKSGSLDSFEADWEQALATHEQRWFSYPAENARTQTEMFEWVKSQQIDQLLEKAGIRSGRVMEYGCGSGGISIYLANRGYQAWATDLSVNALHIAEQNAEMHGAKEKLYRTCCDTFKLPFPDGSFDVVMSYGLLEHFDPATTLPVMLKEVIRVLRPGGMFLADIVPGIERFSIRTIGVYASYITSWLAHIVTGKFDRARTLRDFYFEHMYENTLDDRAWNKVLQDAGLNKVEVQICRPFPPLAVGGGLERLYLQFMKAALPFWKAFDRSNFFLKRYWGWMYLVHGLKK